ncbi:MAG: hypothetical protein LQ351_005818 [Letrouitia transgressa]|nr:MAG: hypothetical protein LQ351_005818 [Letrouitia transgressa]
MRLSQTSPSSVGVLALALSLSISVVAAQGNLPALTDNSGEQALTDAAKPTKAKEASSQDAKPTQKAKAPKTDPEPSGLPEMTSAGPPALTDLPTLEGAKAPVQTVPPTAGAPYMQKSKLPEGTVFIAVGAALGFVGLVVLAWRGLVAWSLHRSVKKAAMAQSTQYSHLRDAKSKGTTTPRTPLYSQGLGSTLSIDQLAANSRGGSKSNTARSSLFFSPTAGAGMQTPGNRGSGYLPAGYYAPGNSAASGGAGMTQIGGGGSVSGIGHHNRRYSRAKSMGPSPPGTPSLPPSRGAEVAFGRPSTAGLSSRGSTSSLNLTAPQQGRAPSAYLEELFEGHSSRQIPEKSRGDRRP